MPITQEEQELLREDLHSRYKLGRADMASTITPLRIHIFIYLIMTPILFSPIPFYYSHITLMIRGVETSATTINTYTATKYSLSSGKSNNVIRSRVLMAQLQYYCGDKKKIKNVEYKDHLYKNSVNQIVYDPQKPSRIRIGSVNDPLWKKFGLNTGIGILMFSVITTNLIAVTALIVEAFKAKQSKSSLFDCDED